MREPVRVIASFNLVGDVVPLYVKIEKGEKEVQLKVEEYYKKNTSLGQERIYKDFRCISTYAGRRYEYTLDFQKSSSIWYITASNSTIEGLLNSVPGKKKVKEDIDGKY